MFNRKKTLLSVEFCWEGRYNGIKVQSVWSGKAGCSSRRKHDFSKARRKGDSGVSSELVTCQGHGCVQAQHCLWLSPGQGRGSLRCSALKWTLPLPSYLCAAPGKQDGTCWWGCTRKALTPPVQGRQVLWAAKQHSPAAFIVALIIPKTAPSFS